MKLPTWVKISTPTQAQLKHDAYLVVVAFVATALSVWQAQPDSFSKSAAIAAVTAGVAAVVTVVKSILTTV
jgi:hypothetical protein